MCYRKRLRQQSPTSEIYVQLENGVFACYICLCMKWNIESENEVHQSASWSIKIGVHFTSGLFAPFTNGLFPAFTYGLFDHIVPGCITAH